MLYIKLCKIKQNYLNYYFIKLFLIMSCIVFRTVSATVDVLFVQSWIGIFFCSFEGAVCADRDQANTKSRTKTQNN